MRGRAQILRKGETVLDTYTVEFFLGQGAFGEVYRVKHRFLGLVLQHKRHVEGGRDVTGIQAKIVLGVFKLKQQFSNLRIHDVPRGP